MGGEGGTKQNRDPWQGLPLGPLARIRKSYHYISKLLLEERSSIMHARVMLGSTGTITKVWQSRSRPTTEQLTSEVALR